MMKDTRRRFLRKSALIGAASALAPHLKFAAADKIAPFRTPYKYPELILKGTGHRGDFDEHSVDDPIVFRANGIFHMQMAQRDARDCRGAFETVVSRQHYFTTNS